MVNIGFAITCRGTEALLRYYYEVNNVGVKVIMGLNVSSLPLEVLNLGNVHVYLSDERK